MEQLYGPIYTFAAGFSGAVAYTAWTRRRAPGAVGLAVGAMAMALWALLYAVQWVYTDHGPSLIWLALRMGCTWTAAVGIFYLAADYSDSRVVLTRPLAVTVALLAVANFALMLTDPWHHLFLGNAEPGLYVLRGGIGMTLQGVVLYAIMAASVALIVRAIARSRGAARRHAVVMFVAIGITCTVLGLEQAGVVIMPGTKAGPAVWGYASLILALEMYGGGLFQVVPLAREQVIEEMPEGMLVFDRDGALADLNPAAVAMLGGSTRLVGRPAAEVFAGWGARAAGAIAQVGTGRGRTQVALSEEPPLVVEVSVSLVGEADGAMGRTGAAREPREATIVIVRDVTERARAEAEQREFVANASHEMQTPLAGIALLGSTIREAAANDPSQLDVFLERLSVETDRLVGMTSDLLALARLDDDVVERGSRWTRVDMGALLEGEVAEAALLGEAAGVTVAVGSASGDTVASPSLTVLGDTAELRSAIGNLLENAVHYTPRGGSVAVWAEAAVDAKGVAGVVVRVADTGVGIAPEDQSRVFDRFYRVDKARARATGGTGLGLSIVRSTVVRHGGTVSLTSTLGEGSTFTVWLPAAG